MMVVNLDDAGYWNSPEQCHAADEIRSLIGLLAKAHAELDELKETCINHAQIQNALLAERDAALAQLEKYQNLEPVAWMNSKRDMSFLYGPYSEDDIPLYALEEMKNG